MKRTSSELLLLSVLFLAGCGQQTTGNVVAAVLTPNRPPKTVGVQCLASSSGTCYFGFYGLATGDAMVSLAPGSRTVVNGLTPDTLYCAESQEASLEHCTQLFVPREQALIQRNIHSERAIELAR